MEYDMALLSGVKTVQPDSQQIWAESALLSGVKTVHPDSQQIWAVSSLSSGVKTVQPDSLQPVGFKTNSVLVLKLCSQRLPVRPPVERAYHCGSIGIGPIFIWLCGTMFCGIAGAWHHLLKGWPPWDVVVADGAISCYFRCWPFLPVADGAISCCFRCWPFLPWEEQALLSSIGWKFIRLHLSEASTEAKDPEILSGNFR